MARADSQVEFRFKMQESIVKRESDGTLFETAAKSVLNADQRIIMLERRIESDLEDLRYYWNRQQSITYNIAREREERSVSSRQQSPIHYNNNNQQQQNGNENRHYSPFMPNKNQPSPTNNKARRHPSATAFKPAPQPQSLPAEYRRPVQPVALKYAKPGETAPQSVTKFLEEQREGSFERPASEIKPEVSSPDKAKMHEPNASDVNTNNEAGEATTRNLANVDVVEDDAPVLAAQSPE